MVIKKELCLRLSKVFKRNRRRKYQNLTGYIFIMPWLLGFLAFIVIPMVTSLYLSFTRYDILSPPAWIGLGNYKLLLYDDKFWKSLKITFYYVFMSVPLKLIFALFLAILFTQKRMMVGLYRTLFYIPSLIGGSVAIAVVWRIAFGVEGMVNIILRFIGVTDKTFGWISDPKMALWTIILLGVWQFGSPMLIFLAGLKQIPISLYEAASIDGANWWQRFGRITIPMLSPIIFFNITMQTISAFIIFTPSYIITGGGPFENTMVYTLYMYKSALEYYKMGYSSALAWVLFFILATFTFIFFKSAPRWVYYETKGLF